MFYLSSVHRHLSSERDRFTLWVPVLLGVGIGVYFALPEEPGWRLPLLITLAFFALTFLARHDLGWRTVSIVAGLIALGVTVATWRTLAVAAPFINDEMYYREVQARIDDIREKEKGQKLILSHLVIQGLKPEETPHYISVTLREDMPALAVGDQLTLKATLFPPPLPAMPGSYDFARQFYYERIGAVGYAPKLPVIEEKGAASGFEEWLNHLRLSLAARIAAPMAAQNAPVAAALMVGEMSNVSKEVADAMRDAGLYHVLSISGLHMSLAAGLIFVSLRFLLCLYPPWALRLPVKKIAAGAGLLGAFVYLLLAGYPVPAIRSFVMVACVMLAVLFDRRGISLYSLAWAALLVLLFQPEALTGASFQLSFAATLGILAFYERYRHLLYEPGMSWRRRIWLYFIGLMTTSLVASLATTPLVIYHFNRFSLWGIAANMLMVPLATFWIMPAAVLAFLMMPLGLERLPLVWLDYGIGWMIAGSRWFAQLPYASVAIPPPSFAGLLLVVLGGLWLCLWQQRWRLLGLPLMLAGLATVALHQPYDLLVSDDGSHVALRLPDGHFLFAKGKPDSFDAQVWLRYHGQDGGLLPKDRPELATCDDARCLYTLHGHSIAIGMRKRAKDNICEGRVDIAVSTEYLNDEECEHVSLLLDRWYLRNYGAVAVRLANGIEVFNANDSRGRRPWVQSPLVPPGNRGINER